MSRRRSYRTGDQTLVREINLSLIMRRLLEHGSLSRASLADLTGLNKSTVSSLVQELLAMGFVYETGLNSRGVGRPSVMLALNPAAGYIVSCELGVDFVSVITTDFGTDVIWRFKESTQSTQSQAEIMGRVIALIREAIAMGAKLCQHCGGLLGIAVGVPGLIEQSTGTLLFAPNLRWENVPIRDILSGAFRGIPLFVDNEANMAALGENVFGAAKGYDEVLYISAGVGVGGAVVRNGHLSRGTTGFASEFGHMTMDPEGELCNCGNRGCWETLVSQAAVFRHIRAAADAGKKTLIQEMIGEDWSHLTIPMVIEAAQAGDAVALETFERVGHFLGMGIASLVNAFNPDLVVFGGILSLAGDYFMPIVRAELKQRALRWNAEATEVLIAHHGFDACVMGGVATLFQAIVLEPGRYNLLEREP